LVKREQVMRALKATADANDAAPAIDVVVAEREEFALSQAN
jgi:hypothetical protein